MIISIKKGDWIETFLNQSRDDVLFSWWWETRLGERVVVGPNCTKASVPNGGESRLRVSNHAVYRDGTSPSAWNKKPLFEHRLLFRRYTHTHTRVHLDSHHHHRHHHPLCAKTSSFCRPIQKELVALSFRVEKEKGGRKSNSISIIYLYKNIDI